MVTQNKFMLLLFVISLNSEGMFVISLNCEGMFIISLKCEGMFTISLKCEGTLSSQARETHKHCISLGVSYCVSLYKLGKK